MNFFSLEPNFALTKHGQHKGKEKKRRTPFRCLIGGGWGGGEKRGVGGTKEDERY